jgi:hypothetical protein
MATAWILQRARFHAFSFPHRRNFFHGTPLALARSGGPFQETEK